MALSRHPGRGVGDHFLRVSEARVYIKERYGISYSDTWIKQLVKRKLIRGVRPGGPRGWIYVSRESIDALFLSADPFPSEPSDR